MLDLTSLAQKLGFRTLSLQALSCLVLGCRLSKRQQRTNWERRDLTKEQVLYAATDAWVSRELALSMVDVPSLFPLGGTAEATCGGV